MESYSNVLLYILLLSVFLRINSSYVVDCSQRSINFDGSSSVNFTCHVCCTDDNSTCNFTGDIELEITGYDSEPESSTVVTSEISSVTNSTDDKSVINATVSNFVINSTDDAVTNSLCNFHLLLCKDCSGNNSTVILSLGDVVGFNGSYNQFVELPCFEEWYNLQWIDLSYNEIHRTNTLYFGKNSPLKTLILRNNPLKNVQKDTFSHLSKIQHLDLSYNSDIREFRFLENLPSLKMVDLRSSAYNTGAFCLSFNGNCRESFITIVDNRTLQQETSPCSNLSCPISFEEWKNISFDQCVDVSTTPGIYVSPDSNETDKTTQTTEPEVTDGADKIQFCRNFPSPFSDNGCVPFFVVMLLILLGVILISLVIKYRKRIRREGRYGRWMSVYSPKVSFQVKDGDTNIE